VWSLELSPSAPSALTGGGLSFLGRCPRLLHFAPLALGELVGQNVQAHLGPTMTLVGFLLLPGGRGPGVRIEFVEEFSEEWCVLFGVEVVFAEHLQESAFLSLTI
jgi:hypothetical protein